MQSSTQRSGFENVRARKPDEAWHQTALWFLNPLDPHNEPSWETATDDRIEGMTHLDAESGTFENTNDIKTIARSYSTFVTQSLAQRAPYPDQWANLMIYDTPFRKKIFILNHALFSFFFFSIYHNASHTSSFQIHLLQLQYICSAIFFTYFSIPNPHAT